MTLNIIATFIVLMTAMTVTLIITAPKVPVATLVPVLIGVSLVVPAIAYPFTYLLWFAGDLAAHRPDAGELAEAHVALVASGAAPIDG